MLDWANIEQYRENNRLEAKKAQGGLPHSIWETYSAFANAYGGMILLGVVEDKENKTFSSVPLPSPEQLVADFWNTLSDPSIVSVNILQQSDVRIVESGENRIVVIEIPRASRRHRPVYIGGDPFSGTYFRNGEGDCRCSVEAVRAMLRERADLSQDSRVQEKLTTADFDPESLVAYRTAVSVHAGGDWAALSDTDFLRRAGAVACDAQGLLRPSAAGILMLGRREAISTAFPRCVLDYQESTAPQNRITTIEGDWNGNLYTFFRRVTSALERTTEDAALRLALREAVVNALIHADYHSPHALVIQKLPRQLRIANPGAFRVDPKRAMQQGVSDRRNATLAHLFDLMGEGNSGGLAAIRELWQEKGWRSPEILETFGPERTVLTLPLQSPLPPAGAAESRCAAIIDYLTAVPYADASAIAAAAGLTPGRTLHYLRLLRKGGVVARKREKQEVYYYLLF